MPVPHFNFAFFKIIYGFYSFQAQAPRHGHPHSIFVFAIPILINILALKYQNQSQSPFATHPKTVLSVVIVLLLYFLAFDYHQRLEMHLHRPVALAGFIHRCVLFLGYMAMATLASLIFPDSVTVTTAVYALYVALSVGDVVVIVCRGIGGWLRRMMIQGDNQGHLIPL